MWYNIANKWSEIMDKSNKFLLSEFDGSNENIIEIVSNDSAMGCLKKSGNNNIKVCLPLLLSFGSLLDLKDYKRVDLGKIFDNEDWFWYSKLDYDFSSLIELLKEYAKKCEMIRIWSSHLDANDYLLMLYICSLFPNKKISVVFTEEYNWYCYDLGMMDSKEIPELIRREHILLPYQIEDYKNEWNKIVENNAELRIIENGIIKGVSIDNFNDKIVEILDSLGEVTIYNLIGELIGQDLINNAGDCLYKYLIERLIKMDRIEIVSKENNKIIIRTQK